MAGPKLMYVAHHLLDGRAHVVVDGAPTEGTTLVLTHWPGYPPPAGLERDLSAQMAFAYTDAGREAPAGLVSNNHFDQDGLVAIMALTDPEEAGPRRHLLEDLAAAGDFATYRDRRAARLSMTIAAFADPLRSPLTLGPDYQERSAQLYTDLLGRMTEMCDHVERYEGLWGEEDAALDRSEELISTGAVVVTEYPTEDLAVVDVPERAGLTGGHRFAHDWSPGLHPMALHNATDRAAVLICNGRGYDFSYRYESWVQYRSRPIRPRRDLSPLATRLSAAEPAGTRWTYDGSQALVPRLRSVPTGESGIPRHTMVTLVREALRHGAPDWDPYPARQT